MGALTTILQALVLLFLAAWLIVITATCSILFVAACWDLFEQRVRRHRQVDELARARARRHHPSMGRAG